MTNSSIQALKHLKYLFFDEKVAEKFLFFEKIFYPKPPCQECGGPTKQDRRLWRCLKKACRKTVSIAKDSFFEQSRLLYSETLFIGYLWLQRTAASTICSITGHSNTTITAFLRYFNQLASDNVDEELCTIGGLGVEVEIDETKSAKRKYHRGHRIEGAWIFGGIERTENRSIFAEVVENRTALTLVEVIQRRILPGSIIISDCWKAYSGLSELGYHHLTVNHSITFKDSTTGAHTNGIEATWNALKRSIPLRNRSADTVEEQIMTYIWRRQNKRELWAKLVEALRDTKYYY